MSLVLLKYYSLFRLKSALRGRLMRILVVLFRGLINRFRPRVTNESLA